MRQDKIHEMSEKEEAYWWFAARKQMILSLFEKYARPGDELLDAGCGAGLLTYEAGKKYMVTSVDVDSVSIELCKKRKPHAKVIQKNIEQTLPWKNTFKLVCLTDVLEHVDDEKVMKNIHKVLKNNGVVIATVPAYPWLFSYWDVIHQHKRRYTAKSIQELFESSGFVIHHFSYFNSIFFPIILGIRMIKSLISQRKVVSTDCFDLPRSTNNLLFNIFRMETQFAVSHTIPFGLSILVVAKKK